ncbi:MAG: flavodoxin domain-containing protein [Chloroflexota bacterium]
MSGTRLSRRRFLAAAGITLGAATLTCSGLTALGTGQPSVAFPEFTLGESTMPDKILVAYASRAGSTAGVAEAIGRTLAESGAQVEVRLMKEVDDLTPYRAVVAGSAIRGCKLLPEAMQFVQTHRAALAQKPFAAFLVCITLAMPDNKYRDGVAAWLEPVRALVRPVSEGLFAGTLDFSKLPLIPDGLSMRTATAFGVFPQGDHRDWNAIRAWAADLKPVLEA